MKIKLGHIIMVVSIFLLLYTISPLFGSGIPINIDQSPHYLRIFCLYEGNTPAPNNWCPYINGGVPSSQYYYPIMDEIIALLGHIIGLALAYKLGIVLALIMPAIGVYLLLKDHNEFGASVAFALSLLYTTGWHGGGFEETVLVGFWHYTLTIGFLLVAVSFFLKFIENPSKKNLVLAAIFTPFTTHPMTLLTGALMYIVLIIYNHKKILKIKNTFIQFIISVVLLNGFYWLPFILKKSYFPGGIGGLMTWTDFYHYIWKGLPSYLLLMSFLGFAAVLYFKDKKNYNNAIIFAFIWIYTFIGMIHTPFDNIQIGVRIGAFVGAMTMMFSSIFIDYISKIKIKGTDESLSKYAAIIITIVLMLMLASSTVKFKDSILLSDNPYFKEQVNLYKSFSNLGEGRILAEDTLYNFGNYPQTFTHMHSLIPVLSGKDIITFGTTIFPPNKNLIDTAGGKLFGIAIENWKTDDLIRILSEYNIRYVLAHTPNYINYFANHSVSYKTYGPFVMFDTGIEPTYIDMINGKIISESYKGRSATAVVQINGSAIVILETNFYPNWKAYLNDERIETYSCNGLVCANVDKNGVVDFKYGLTTTDWLGYIISIAGIVYLIYFIKSKRGA